MSKPRQRKATNPQKNRSLRDQLMGQQGSHQVTVASTTTTSGEEGSESSSSSNELRSNSSTTSTSSNSSRLSSSSSSSSGRASSRSSIRFSSDSDSNFRIVHIQPSTVHIDLASSSSSSDDESVSSDSSRMSTRTLRSESSGEPSVRAPSASSSSSSSAGSSDARSERAASVLSTSRRPVHAPVMVCTSRGRGRGRPASRTIHSPLLPAIEPVVDIATTSILSPAQQAQNSQLNRNITMNYSMNTVTFECIVCLENLATPATVIENRNELNNDNPTIGGLEAVVAAAAAVGGDRMGEVAGGGGQAVFVMAGGGGRGRGGRGGRMRPLAASRRRTSTIWDPREIASTPCGHLYHRYCIEKWFTEQGKKTCPSCRKAIPGKMIRLYPNMGQEMNAGNRNFQLEPLVAAQALGRPAATVTAYNDAAVPPEWDVVLLPAPPAGTQMAPNVSSRRRQVPNNNCQNPGCADLLVMHTTLVSDYNEIQERFFTISDDMALRNAENQSLQESFDQQRAEIQSLQERYDQQRLELEQLRANPRATGVKRRRQQN